MTTNTQQQKFFEEIEEGSVAYWGKYKPYTCDKYQDDSWTWENVLEEYEIFFEELELKFWNSTYATEEEEEKNQSGFGTQYHDGSGFADCDSENTGHRICARDGDKSKWCSECVYILTQQEVLCLF